jgi:hypothetical protein
VALDGALLSPLYHSWGDILLVEQHMRTHCQMLREQREAARLAQAIRNASNDGHAATVAGGG